MLTKPGRFVYLARKVDDATAKKVKDLHLAGIAQTDESARMRPAADLAAPLIGTVGLDNDGLGGIERQYESTLAGKPGSIVVDADRHLRRIASGEKTVNPSVAGNDLELTHRSRPAVRGRTAARRRDRRRRTPRAASPW